ncbi:unnamed protein product [Dibothriocephalus latus]|uniref:Uncharacterized protein n=1 Tax=Dibothriocephalus latus TaxID=60516 RepID=A0A3P7MPC7_DIBLA|nr:unnamed protein product [Dibothriocephalus latus]
MLSTKSLISLLFLASAVLLSRAYPKAQEENEEELKETKRTLVEEEDDADLLESVLAETGLLEEMETPAEVSQENITVLRPATSRRWKKFVRRVEQGFRRAFGPKKKRSKKSDAPAPNPVAASQSQNSGLRIIDYIVLTGICMFIR